MSSVIGHTKGSSPRSRSPAVNAAITPGIDAAADVSIESILAWTYGGRTSPIHAIPGIVWLSMKLACPVMSSGSSLRRTAWPMTFSVATTPIAPSGPGAGHGPGGVEDGPHDVLVAGAPAEVPLQRQAEFLLRGRRILLQVARRG